MRQAVRFYEALGFSTLHGGADASFTTFAVGSGFLNLVSRPERCREWWGRVIFYVSDVDGFYRRAADSGLAPSAEPRDAEWGERFFHIIDPDGHELSFARPL
jgi:catechol 2,3-dioxygenase-like lactoylglutathione lyase family enzyme